MWANHRVLRGLLRVGLCLAFAGAALGAPSPRPAEAAELVVDRDDDAPATACTGAASDCTLRGAIQIANTNGVTDTITFLGNRAITLLSTLVLTGTGTTIQATAGQVVKINANNIIGNVFQIRADDITLDGLRVYGAGAGRANIWIRDTAQRIKIANSAIGDDTYGVRACGNSPNSHSGIYIDSAADPAPGDAVAWIYGSEIKCNGGAPGHGIQIDGAREVVIGADALGNATSAQRNFIEGNAGDGTYLSSGASLNTIRNSFLENNDGNGLVIDGSNSNSVYGNYFYNNDFNGIELRGGAPLNQIGCPLGTLDPNNSALRNVIRNNNGNGILITGAGTNSNQIFCNWIGVWDDGMVAAPNLGQGVIIEGGARLNRVGDSQGTGNVISGNNDGVLITGAGTNDNLVRGNRIGTNAAGSGPVPNHVDGVEIVNGASQNTIGGTSAHLNLIAGNTRYGVYISSGGTATNTVTYNDIGYNSLGGGLPIPNGSDGLTLESGTHHNVIGGVGLGNNLAYNLGNGLSLRAGAHHNSISVNSIFSNTQNGVLFDGANTLFNVMTGTIIYNNGQDGIAERNQAALNVWQHLSTYANGGLGVDKNAASGNTNLIDPPFPTITLVNTGTGAIAGTAANGAIVEVYLAYPDVLRFGEGKTFVGSTVANGSGLWNITVTPGLPGCLTALQIFSGVISASEFGPNTCLQSFVPVVRR